MGEGKDEKHGIGTYIYRKAYIYWGWICLVVCEVEQ